MVTYDNLKGLLDHKHYGSDVVDIISYIGQPLGVFTTAYPITPGVGVYLFAGTDEAIVSGTVYNNGDSAFWDGSVWTRIPKQVINIEQVRSQSTNLAPSSKLMDDELSKLVDKSAVKQVIGTSETDVMSQKGVSDIFNTIIGVGKNLFDKSNVLSGGYIDASNGTSIINDGGTLSYTPLYIPVIPDTQYILNNPHNYILFYDQNKVFISPVTTSLFTTPPNAYYIRIDLPTVNIDLLQLEVGSVSTSYEAYKMYLRHDILKNKSIGRDKLTDDALTISINDIADNSLTPAKMTFFDTSKNLFDGSAKYEGYINNSNGVTLALDVALWSSLAYIPVLPSTQYTSSHLGGWILYYREDKTFISAENFTSNSVTTPVDCHFVRIDVYASHFNTYQFELGAVTTAYVPFDNKTLKQEHTPSLPISKMALDVIIVSKKGNGNYTTIQAAVTAALDGDTILVMPGEYEEYVICGSKNISIIGIDRQKCILWNSTGDYSTCPLYMSKGMVKNMTIRSEYDPLKDYSSITNFAYAIHIDNYGANGTFLIEDCDLYSAFNNVLGCGATANHKLIVRRCEIIASADAGKSPNCLNYHGGANGISADIILDSNRMTAPSHAIIFPTNGTPNTITIYCYFNKVTGEILIPSGGIYEGIFNISADSFGNNSTLLNA